LGSLKNKLLQLFIMLNIPFVKSPNKNACALASYTMVAKHFFPDTTLEEISKISMAEPGYVVWAFKFWIWLLDKGISITEYDRIDYKAWAEEGIKGLKQSTSEKEFEFYKNNTKDLESYSGDMQKLLQHKGFTHKKQNPTFDDLENANRKGFICELVLDSQVLNNGPQFSLHRVIPIEIAKDFISFHDPDVGPSRRVSQELFKKAWLESISEPELCIYSR